MASITRTRAVGGAGIRYLKNRAFPASVRFDQWMRRPRPWLDWLELLDLFRR